MRGCVVGSTPEPTRVYAVALRATPPLSATGRATVTVATDDRGCTWELASPTGADGGTAPDASGDWGALEAAFTRLRADGWTVEDLALVSVPPCGYAGCARPAVAGGLCAECAAPQAPRAPVQRSELEATHV